METKTTAIVAILAVAALAFASVGYAAYWGQTEVDDNVVDSRYITVALTETAGADYTAIDVDVDYNTVYSYDSGAKYTISPNGFKDVDDNNYGFETKIIGYNLIPLKNKTAEGYTVLDNYEFTLKAPESTAAGTYDFQVMLTGVTLGSAATLYFAYTAAADTLTSSTPLYQFYPTGNANEYVSVVSAPAVTTADAPGYADTYYGYLFVGIEGTATPVPVESDTFNKVIVDDVTKAKAKIDDGTMTFQALVTAEETTSVEVPATITAITGSTVTPGEHFDTIIVASFGGSNITNVALAANAITVTQEASGASEGYVLFKITKDGDTFYRVSAINIP